MTARFKILDRQKILVFREDKPPKKISRISHLWKKYSRTVLKKVGHSCLVCSQKSIKLIIFVFKIHPYIDELSFAFKLRYVIFDTVESPVKLYHCK